MLNLARGAQGVGGAIMFATSLALIASAFHGKERGTAFGIYGAVIGGAVAVGPLIGGAITSGLGWRWIFFVNVPVGVVAIVLTLTRVQESKEPNHRRIDWIGFVSFSAALFMLVFALVRGNDDGWGSTMIVGLLIGAAVLLAVFVVAEWRQSDPMLDLTLFRQAGHDRLVDRGHHPVGVDLRPVPVHHALRPGRPRLRPLRGRAPLPADHHARRSSWLPSPAS